ncbi:alpha-1,4-glucan--maltose-1-phosphate maltosyltransferase [Propionibacteriaceae bacterium Y1923]|uniref:alpha-1,4-glucan--maltose-1-phosphate maltosyltransferase n=1 Tax=Aestuariimicrobium sp. Y1814 TaxID=3418742 RepID=UPI003C26320C
MRATAAPTVATPATTGLERNPSPHRIGRIPVTNVSPVVEQGAYPVKAVEDEELLITANIFREGHDAVGATIVLTDPEGGEHQFGMKQVEPTGLDVWQGWARVGGAGEWTYRIEGWSDPWHTWLHHAEAKLAVGMDVALVCLEGADLFRRAAANAAESGDQTTATVLESLGHALLPERPTEELLELATATSVRRAMDKYGPRELVSPTAEVPVRVERRRAAFSSWYEFFPRSQGAHRREDGTWVSGTFAASHERLEAAAAMGFDIVYLPPIHPIGTAFRKGKNNSLTPSEQDPGSPWAIGSPAGGHDAIHPDLGTIDDFDEFVAKAKSLGLEIAMDFALQASPDHPWVTEHPEWFTTRLDGTIAYAENPPKKYQDIYPINFDNDPVGIYTECLRILEYWISHGVTVFRVDNPHTKPLDFWDWLLDRIHEKHPEVIFLAEAFTRPQMMKGLGKVGYQLSYTYFTWRTTKDELTDYVNDLAQDWSASYRPSFWVNTPDINPFHLQSGNRSAFAIRAVLAATLSPSWGVYSGFELFEHEALAPGREEYLDSEKYEYRPRDYNAQPNLNELLGKLNHLRRQNPALQQLRRVVFHQTSHPSLLAYSKVDGDSHVLTVVTLDPDHDVHGEVTIDFAALGLPGNTLLQVSDQFGDPHSWTWGATNYVHLHPGREAHILQVTSA